MANFELYLSWVLAATIFPAGRRTCCKKIRLNLAYGLIYELDPDFFLLNNRTCRKWKIKMILCMLFFVQLYWSDCQGIMWEKVGQTRCYHLKNKSKSRSFSFFLRFTRRCSRTKASERLDGKLSKARTSGCK